MDFGEAFADPSPCLSLTTAHEVEVKSELVRRHSDAVQCPGLPSTSSSTARETIAHTVEYLDPRTRKLLGRSASATPAQLRTCLAVQGHPLWTRAVMGVGGQLGGQEFL
jgi:hypothetical protein